MTEFAVLTLVMLPIMMGIPMVGKMIDLKQTTINASRYAAWEATVSDDYNVADQIDSRFFKDSESAIKTQNVAPASHRLWGETSAVDPSSYIEKGSVRIADDSAAAKALEVNITNGVQGGSTNSLTFGGVVKDSGEILSWAPGTDWGVNDDGLLRAAVQVKIKQNYLLNQSNSACFEEGKTFSCMTEANSIMVDNWSASNDRQAADRVRSFVPTTAIRDVSDILAAIGEVPTFAELKGLKRKNGKNGFGHVEMNVLPEKLDTYVERYEGQR
jgi:hypothetical protein